MKKISIISLVALSSLTAVGQSIDDLVKVGGAIISSGQAAQEKGKFSKAAAKYNADQPNVSLGGARVVIRESEDSANSWRYDERTKSGLKPSFCAMITAVDGRPVWDDKDIDNESASRAHHRDNDEVNQATLPGKGRIIYRNTIIEFAFVEFEKSSDSELAIGRWWNQNRLRMSRETAYFGLTVTVRDGDTGEVLAVYKTLGSASSSDNVGAQIAGGFFSNSVSYSSNGNSE